MWEYRKERKEREKKRRMSHEIKRDDRRENMRGWRAEWQTQRAKDAKRERGFDEKRVCVKKDMVKKRKR